MLLNQGTDDPPPAFPQWLREWDPLLAEEDTNPIFEAFRRRRLVYPPPLARRVWSRIRLPLLEGVVNALILLLAFYTAAALPAIWILPVLGLALGAGYATRAFGEQSAPPRSLVERLAPVLSRPGHPCQVLYDIALCGATPREMFIALYLEHREDLWRREALAVALGSGAVILAYSFLGDPFSPRGAALLVGVAFMAWKVLEAVTVNAIDRFASDTAVRSIHTWRGDSILTSGFAGLGGHLRFEVAAIGPIAVVILVMFASLLLVRAASIGIGAAAGPGLEFRSSYPGEVLGGLLLCGSAFALHLYSAAGRRRALIAFNRRAAEAESPLREFFHRSFEVDRS